MASHPLHGVVPGDHTRAHHHGRLHARRPAAPPLAADAAPPVCCTKDAFAAPSHTYEARAERAVTFSVNGESRTADGVDPRTTLASYLRDTLRLTGTKIGCGEGGCGACTVMITATTETVIANACLRPLLSLDGCHVLTTEGLGSADAGFGPVQKALAAFDGSQCGYCSPGFTVAMSPPRPAFFFDDA